MPKSPFPPGYRPTQPLTGNVQIPGPDDPYSATQIGRDQFIDFGIDAQNAIGNLPAPVTQSERGADAYLRAIGKIPDMPRDLMQMNQQQRFQIGAERPFIGDLRRMDEMAMPQFGKPEKPSESYGLNRGGSGGAGRGAQLGKSQFDIAPQFMDAPDEIDDKPWELDEQTKEDVQPGLSLTPKPEQNVVDKEPDLQSPQGLYQALAKKYPDILTQNLDQLQQGRVTMEDVDALRDRSGLGSLFIASSKAAAGAGSIGGKTAESIAPTIVNREDTLARQQLKDRMDVASENMALNAKAVDLAMKQINFADEREQYDPNSEVSKFARQFMQDEFEVKVPDNVPAYQLKQFLPAVVQKYQAKERASYQSALLGQRTAESLLNDAYKRYEAALKSGDKRAQIEAQKQIANLRSMQKSEPKPPKPEKMRGSVPKEQADAEMKLADKFNAEPAVKKFKTGEIAMQEMESLANEQTYSGDQGLINGYAKILDPESVVREGEYAVVARGGGILNQIKNKLEVSTGGALLQPAQRQMLLEAARALQRGRQSEYSRIRERYNKMAADYELDPGRTFGTEDVAAPAGKPTGGRSLEQIRAEKEAIRKQLEEIQKGKGK